jgi:hypothetical protein
MSLSLAAASAALLAITTARADVLLESFETGGFDYPGPSSGYDENTGTWSVSYGTLATSGVTDGLYSLHVTQSGTNWWANLGLTEISAADLAANSVIQFDVLTSTGVQFIPIFHQDPTLPGDPTSGGYHQYNDGIYIPAGAGTQTFSFDYTTAAFNSWDPHTGLPAAANAWTFQLQGSNGNGTTTFNMDFYIDNVRLTGTIPELATATSSWKVNGSGSWVNAANWDSDPAGTIPGAIGSIVTFGTHNGDITTTDQIVVNVSQAVTVGQMIFDKGDGGYKIAGALPVNVTGSIIVNNGSHQISAPVSAAGGAIFNVGTGNTLTIDNLGGGGYGLFEKEGGGVLITDKMQNITLNLLGGTVEFKPGNAQNNGWIYGLNVFNGSTFKMNGAVLRTNGIYSNATPGTIDLGTGGVLSTGLYSGAAFFGTITGAGSLIVGATHPDDAGAPPSTVTLGGVNTYTGTTSVVHGNVLEVSAAANLGDGSPTNYLILDQGTLRATGSFSSTRKVSIGTGGGTIDTNGNDVGFGVIDPGPFIKSGAGVLSVTRLENLPSATISAGTLRIAAGGGTVGTSKVNALSISDGASVDLTDHALVVDYESAGSIVEDTRANIVAGKITSSLASGTTGVGYGDNAVLAKSTFEGASVDSTSLLMKYTYFGDTDLDGDVDVGDLGSLASAWQTAGVWTSGDFDYNGSIDVGDLGKLATNWQAGVGNPLGPSLSEALAAVGLPSAAVPEPATLGLIGLALVGLRRRARL